MSSQPINLTAIFIFHPITGVRTIGALNTSRKSLSILRSNRWCPWQRAVQYAWYRLCSTAGVQDIATYTERFSLDKSLLLFYTERFIGDDTQKRISFYQKIDTIRRSEAVEASL